MPLRVRLAGGISDVRLEARLVKSTEDDGRLKALWRYLRQELSDLPGWWKGLPPWKRWLPWAFVPGYWIVLAVTAGELKGDHFLYGGSILVLAHLGRPGHRMLSFLLPFILIGIIYDGQRYFADAIRGTIHVAEPYLLELRLFGINTPDGVRIPAEWFADHLHPVLDLISGAGYLTFVFVFLGMALYFDLWLVETGKGTPLLPSERLRELAPAMAWSFLAVNVLGYSTWILYPAAPPWYVEQFGLGPAIADFPAQPARTVRFDQLLGTHFFTDMYGYGSNAFGAIPSLHVAYPLMGVYFAFRFGALRVFATGFWLLMCFAAVYLNHHYVIDVILGSGYGLAVAPATLAVYRRVAGGSPPSVQGSDSRTEVPIMTHSLRTIFLVSALGGAATASDLGAQEPPDFRIDSQEKFEATSIAPYEGSHDRVYRYIDAHLEEHLANLQRWLRQRSISAQDVGIDDMAEMVRSDLERIGFQEAELVPTGGHPGVWGYYDAGADKTLMVYMMYDVQPVNPEDWRSPPFEANLVESELGTILMARGATNQKGPERAFLNALEAIIAVEGGLPVNLMVTAEGEEEIGSPHYPEIIDRYEERLRSADGVVFPFNSQSPGGAMNMSLGVKGLLYVEMEATGGPWGGPTAAEIHGSYKAIVDSPVLRLVEALSSMVSDDGNTILVDDYYDDVREPTDEEELLINSLAEGWDDRQRRRALGVDRWIDGVEGRKAILRYLYHPTLNIDGIWGGYTGPGPKTILPHMATAKVDSRLPPDLDPDEALRRIREHLDGRGFIDVEIRKLAAYPASQTSVTAPIVEAAISVFNKYGHPPTVSPRLAGSAPFYQFSDRLDLPLVFSGLGHGSGAHAPNEYMVIEPAEGSAVAGLAEIEKAYVDLLYALAGG